MSLRPVLVLLLLAGCSRGEDADLQYIGEARSLAAEWALINEQSNEGHLTTSYVKTMRGACGNSSTRPPSRCRSPSLAMDRKSPGLKARGTAPRRLNSEPTPGSSSRLRIPLN